MTKFPSLQLSTSGIFAFITFIAGFGYVLIPIKDVITGFLWIIPFFTNKVSWRNNKYIIGKYTKLRPNESAGFSLRMQFMRLKTIIN